MKLSMSMLKWFLHDFEMQASIHSDERTIEGVRFLFGDEAAKESKYVYLLQAENVISDLQHREDYILAHKTSYIICKDCLFETLMNQIMSAFSFFNEWEQQLMSKAYTHVSVQELFPLIGPVIDNPCALTDLTLTAYAYVNSGQKPADPYWNQITSKGGPHPAAAKMAYKDVRNTPIAELSQDPILVTNVYEGGAPVLMMYLYTGEGEKRTPTAVLAMLQANPQVTTMDLQLAPLVAQYLLLCREFTEPGGHLRPTERLLMDILNGHRPETAALSALKATLPEELLQCMILRNIARKDLIYQRAMLHTLNNSPYVCYCISYQDNPLVILKAADLNKLLAQRTSIDIQNLSIGISLPFANIKDLQQGYSQAEFALMQAGQKPGAYTCRDFAFTYMIRALKQENQVEMLKHPAIQILHQFDEETGSDLLPTLRSYVMNNLRITDSAQELCIHTNTLKYRIRKITEMCGIHWDDVDDFRLLVLSLWLDEV